MKEGRLAGVLVGIVRDLEDPLGLGRVRVAFPTLGDQLSEWAPLISFMAGAGRGGFFRPELDEAVAVAFEHQDPERPLVLGGMWSRADPPPDSGGDDRANNWRTIVSRSGAILRFDDSQGGEKVELIDKDGTRRLVLDSVAGKIRIEADSGEIEVKASGAITLEGQSITLKATQSVTIEAGQSVKVSGSTIELN
jgi:uncharacterized protein involved in type VI secretion and phage assembly